MLGIPEKGLITVHIKGNTDTVSYNVTDSSLRVNLGAAFAYLFQGENKITVTFKASEDSIVELFHKDDEQSLFPIFKKSARYADGWRYWCMTVSAARGVFCDGGGNHFFLQHL
jgi:hypothetical protein